MIVKLHYTTSYQSEKMRKYVSTRKLVTYSVPFTCWNLPRKQRRVVVFNYLAKQGIRLGLCSSQYQNMLVLITYLFVHHSLNNYILSGWRKYNVKKTNTDSLNFFHSGIRKISCGTGIEKKCPFIDTKNRKFSFPAIL